MEVVRTAYATAKGMGASDKVMLALFEAGIVESGFRNLGNLGAKNDHDSLGYLQQRPSMGWPNPLDVPTATRSFVSRAMAKEASALTSGQLAQKVQVSAFPLKYDAVAPAAKLLLLQVGGSASSPAAVTAQPLNLLSGGLPGLEGLAAFFSDRHGLRRVVFVVFGIGITYLGVQMILGKAIPKGAIG